MLSIVPIILIALLLLGLAFVAIGVKVFFHKSHKFPETSAGHNPVLRAKGIRCPREEDAALHSPNGKDVCSHCGVDIIKRAEEGRECSQL